MNEHRSFASLGPTLLARKGAARPAMRPQVQALTSFERETLQQSDDLGWNDMGEDTPPAAEVLPLTPAPAGPEASPRGKSSSAKPAVRSQQEAIAREFAAPAPNRKATSQRRSALAEGRRAAFTLRLDSERHLKLRLACTIRNASAQQIITEALDRVIAEHPELDELAAQVKRKCDTQGK